MDTDHQHGETAADMQPNDETLQRPGGFRKVLKRLRSVFIPRRSNKATRRSAGDVAPQAQGSRDWRTPTPPPLSRGVSSQRQFSQTEGIIQGQLLDLETGLPEPTVEPPNEDAFVQQQPLLTERTIDKQLRDLETNLERRTVQRRRVSERPRVPLRSASENFWTSTLPIRHPRTQRTVSDSAATTAAASEASNERAAASPARASSAGASPSRMTSQEHRARAAALFGRYGLNVDPKGVFSGSDNGQPSSSRPRVYKPAKVRVHYHCHRCAMNIGSNGICIACGHRRCVRCHRSPERKDRAGSSSRDGSRASSRRSTRTSPSPVRRETLDNWLLPTAPPTSTSNVSHTFSSFFSRDGVFRTKHVRRLCHVCHSPFIWTETRCQDCDHALCDDCPQDPPPSPPRSVVRAGKSPERSPTRVRVRVLKKPVIRVRYNCDMCGNVFEEGKKVCDTCSHIRCNSCTRWPPRTEEERQPDPEAVEAFRRRLATMP